MRVAVVHVLGMAVPVRHRFMSMPVRMGHLRHLFRCVFVLVVFVVLVLVRMLEGLVGMLVLRTSIRARDARFDRFMTFIGA